MPIFSYKAIDEDGIVVSDTIEGFDLDSVYNNLSRKGLYIIHIKEKGRLLSTFGRGLRRRRIKRIDVIEFGHNLSVMLRAGVPLVSALEDVMTTTEDRYLQERIGEIRREVDMGMSLSEAIEAQKDVFPPIIVRLARVGEETGELDKTISDAVDHLQRVEDLANSIKRALIYPIFTLITSMGALIFWLVFVMPRITALFSGMGIELPMLTKVLFQISEYTKSYWYLILSLPVMIFLIIQVIKRYESGRYFIDSLKLKFPIVSILIYNKLLAMLFEQFYVLIRAGLTIDKSFDMAADVVGNSVFKRAILKSKEDVIDGSSISDAMKKHRVFPLLAVGMINVGETSGSLEKQFEFLTKHYLKKIDDISMKISKMVEPILLGVMGFIFAVVVIGIMLPVYDLISQLPM